MVRNPDVQYDRYEQIKKVTVVGIVINALLAAIKITLGIFGHSQALIADGAHSLADLASDAVVLIASKHGSREADDEHPYGHKRIETVATVILGLLLIAVGIGIMVDAGMRLWHPEKLLQPEWTTLIAAAISVFANEFLFFYTMIVAKRINSRLLKANAWHHRTDSISSVIALIGIGGTLAGISWLDAIAAIGVSLLIIKVGWDIGWHSLRELVDTGLESDRVDIIKSAILNVNGVKEIHSLRSRSLGGQAFIDVHIMINDPKMSVSEGHRISEAVITTLLNDIDEVADVTVHIDPEDDEKDLLSSHLPLRDAIIARLNHCWRDNAYLDRIIRIDLHYLNGKIHVEVILPLSVIESRNTANAIAEGFRKSALELKEVAEVAVHFCDTH